MSAAHLALALAEPPEAGTVAVVCGGRTYGRVPVPSTAADNARAQREIERFAEQMDMLNVTHRFSLIVHGGAMGADTLARIWANRRDIRSKTFVADWKAHGLFAGPKRNAQMLAEAKPHVVIAFPGGKGTADMIAKAKAAGVRLIEITP